MWRAKGKCPRATSFPALHCRHSGFQPGIPLLCGWRTTLFLRKCLCSTNRDVHSCSLYRRNWQLDELETVWSSIRRRHGSIWLGSRHALRQGHSKCGPRSRIPDRQRVPSGPPRAASKLWLSHGERVSSTPLWTTPEIIANPKKFMCLVGVDMYLLETWKRSKQCCIFSYLFEFGPLQIYIAPNASFLF